MPISAPLWRVHWRPWGRLATESTAHPVQPTQSTWQPPLNRHVYGWSPRYIWQSFLPSPSRTYERESNDRCKAHTCRLDRDPRCAASSSMPDSIGRWAAQLAGSVANATPPLQHSPKNPQMFSTHHHFHLPALRKKNWGMEKRFSRILIKIPVTVGHFKKYW